MNENRPSDTAATGGLAAENRPAERCLGETVTARTLTSIEEHILLVAGNGCRDHLYTGCLPRGAHSQNMMDLCKRGLLRFTSGTTPRGWPGLTYYITEAGAKLGAEIAEREIAAFRARRSTEGRTSGSLPTVAAESDPLVTLQNQTPQ
jgi:hypothetical protein